jgi:hypothetical protein
MGGEAALPKRVKHQRSGGAHLGALSNTGSIQHKEKTGVRHRIRTNHNGRYIYSIGSYSPTNPHNYVHKPNAVNYKCISSSKKSEHIICHVFKLQVCRGYKQQIQECEYKSSINTCVMFHPPKKMAYEIF